MSSRLYSSKPTIAPPWLIKNEEEANRLLFDEREFAQAQMHLEKDNGNFSFVSAAIGTSSRHTVGGFDVGVTSFQGPRPTMEDEHLLSDFRLRMNGASLEAQLFGVFDGHGGGEVSQFARNNFQHYLTTGLNRYNRWGLTNRGIINAFTFAFKRLNEDLKSSAIDADRSGSTSIVILIINNTLWVANIGDSRAILCSSYGTKQTSVDASTNVPRFQAEVGASGHGIYPDEYGDLRVEHRLNMTRALGNFSLGDAIQRDPIITSYSLDELGDDLHLIIACDGIFDVASSSQIGSAVYKNRHLPADRLASSIVYSSNRARSTDNQTAMVIKLIR